MRRTGKRKISAGTVMILLLTLAILGGTGFVWSRLSSGKTIDLSKLQPESFDLQIVTGRPEEIQDIPQTSAPKPAATAAPATAVPEEETKGKSFTLTVAGTVALEGEVRKNSYYSDSKQYDYYDIMMLLKKELQSDLNIVFLENLISEDAKANDVTAPGAGLHCCSILKPFRPRRARKWSKTARTELFRRQIRNLLRQTLPGQENRAAPLSSCC